MIRIMKMRTVTFTSLLILCGAIPALASDCTGDGCNFEEIIYEAEVRDPAPMGIVAPAPIPAAAQYAEPPQYIYATPIPMRSIKTLSVKPVPEDRRPKLWDGTIGKYQARRADKTVDWRDGVPIWDDSIVNYQSKDFTDWYLEPTPEVYLREVDIPAAPFMATPADMPTESESVDIMELYSQNMADAAATRARVEELLSPNKPCTNLWTDDAPTTAMPVPKPEYVAQDMTEVVQIAFGRNDGCPFESETECEIWRRKPIVRETLSPRSPKIRTESLDTFISAARCNKSITATDPASAPLLDRYKMLMRSAQACCTDGMAYSLKQAGATDGLVYKFMADDANFYGFGSRCLMMTDQELDTKYPNTATAAVAADVRNGCLCRGRQWFQAMLAPFQQAYAAAPEFAQQKFYYTYTDGLQREVTVSVNNDVQNVLNQLALCP